MGSAYVLFVPGYCLTTAIFPESDDLDRIERIGLSLGFSVALVSVLAVVLDRLHWGLYLWPILLSEFGMTGLFMVVALWRRSQLPPAVAYVGEAAWQS